jgi:hypothetical protein
MVRLDPITIFKGEHEGLMSMLYEIECAIDDQDSKFHVINLLNHLEKAWDKHELREERYLDWFLSRGVEYPHVKMFLDDHNELKGHWKVLKMALKSGEDLKLETAMDTDGKMLIKKFQKHIKEEDKFLEKFSRNQAEKIKPW